jgi:serine/threonine protein kinase
MKFVEHENLIKLKEIIENPEEIIIVMELAMVDLFAFMTNEEYRPRGRFTEKEARSIFTQIVNGKPFFLFVVKSY